MNHLNDFDNEELLDMFEHLKQEAAKALEVLPSEAEDLKSIKQELLRRMTAAAESYCRMGVACPMHDGQVHGQEASELRTKLEQYIEDINVPERSADVSELQHILDSTDARDSLAFEEQAAVEFIVSSEHSDVPELTTRTLEYQVNQLSLANAQLQEAVEFLETELRKMRDRFVQEVPGP